MDLATVVKTYLQHAGGYDLPLHLSQFGLAKQEVEGLFSGLDEDYQISRFLLLSRQEGLSPYPEGLQVFSINGCEYTHVAFRPGIENLLAAD